MGARATWAAVVVLGLLAGLGAVALVGPGRHAHPAPTAPAATPAHSIVLDVLHDWDRSRARAWARGDPAALRRLYVEGSSAGRADAGLLRRYVARGLVVRHLARQVLSVRVLESRARRMRLVVTDRLASGVAVGQDHEVRLPGAAASTRLLVLRRERDAWLVASVRRLGSG